MATEELKIVISADPTDALQDLQTVKKSVKELGASSGTDKLKSSMSGYSQATAQLGAELKNIRNLQMADVFTHVTEALAASKDRMQVATSAFKEFGTELRGAFNFKNFDVSGPKELFQSMKIQGMESITSLKLAFGNLGKAIKAVTSSAAFAVAKVLAVVVALVSAIKTGFSTAQRLTASFYEAQKIGMQHASYQEWAYVMSQVGVEADKLSDFIKGLSAAQNDLRDGSEGMVEAFKALGLSAEEAANMTQEQLFTETIKRLQQMENQVERTGIAYRIFGEDDAAQLTNILNLNNQEMERMINNFYLLGGSASDSAIQKSRTLSAAVSNLRLAWQGFSNTIGEAVMPVLTAIVNALTKAVVAINMFLRAVFGFSIVSKGSKGSIEGASASVGGYTDSLKAATGAAEKLKRTTQGFDELNIVQNPNTGGGGSGDAGAGGGGGSIDIPSMNFEGLTQDLGLDEMAKWFEKNADTIQKWTTRVVAGTVAWKAFTAAVKLFTGKKITLGTLVAGIPKLVTGLKTLIVNLTKGKGLMAAFTAAFPKLAGVVAKVTSGFAAAVKAVGAFIGGLSASTIAIIIAIIVALASAVYFCVQNWDELVRATKNWFDLNIAPKLQVIGDLFVDLWEALVSVWDALVGVASVIWDALPDGVKEWLKNAAAAVRDVVKAIGEWFASIEWLKAIGTVFEWLGGLIVGILGGVIGGAINGVIQLIEGAVRIITGIVQTIAGLVTGLINLIVGLFTGDFSKALDSAKMIWDGIVNIFKGAYDATIGVVVAFVQGIISWFTELWDVLVGHSIVPDMINAIIEWFRQLPGQLFGMVANFVKTVINYFISLATQAGQWAGEMWAKVKKPFEGVGSWFTNVFKQAWNGITGVWNNVTSFFSGVWTKIKNIFSNVGTSIASGVVGAVKGAINSVLRTVANKINTFIGWINNAIGLINKIPGVNIGRIGTISVPQLAKGGIVTGSILANIGERGREAVLPLENNTGWMDALADRIAARNSGSTRVVLQVDGRELGWATIEQINSITEQTGGLQLVL
jgi:phage-related protein